jgi:hypothetical protein
MLGEFSYAGKLYEIKLSIAKRDDNDLLFEFKTIQDVRTFFVVAMAADTLTRNEILEILPFFLPGAAHSSSNNKKHLEQKRLDLLYEEIASGSLIVVQKRILTMTKTQKEQCARLFKIYTEIETEPHHWNEKAADLLAEMVWQVEDCSRGMGMLSAFFPKKLPLNLKPSWRWWLTNVILDLLMNEAKIRKGYVNTICLNEAIAAYRTVVQDRLIN